MGVKLAYGFLALGLLIFTRLLFFHAFADTLGGLPQWAQEAIYFAWLAAYSATILVIWQGYREVTMYEPSFQKVVPGPLYHIEGIVVMNALYFFVRHSVQEPLGYVGAYMFSGPFFVVTIAYLFIILVFVSIVTIFINMFTTRTFELEKKTTKMVEHLYKLMMALFGISYFLGLLIALAMKIPANFAIILALGVAPYLIGIVLAIGGFVIFGLVGPYKIWKRCGEHIVIAGAALLTAAYIVSQFVNLEPIVSILGALGAVLIYDGIRREKYCI